METVKHHQNVKVVFFEINELPFKVLDDYCINHPNSAFAEVARSSHQYESYAYSKRPLEPCFVWPTVHRGVTDEEHGIYDWNLPLTEQDKTFPPFWNILAKSGVKTGVFGCLHSYSSFPDVAELNKFAFYVPDIFSPHSDTHPDHISEFQKLNLDLIRKSGRNVDTGIDWKGAFAFAKYMRKIGISRRTFASLAKQLTYEIISPWKKTRRRSHQAILSFDIFNMLLRKTRPEFASCFVNHVAASMHRYWAAKYLEDYDEYNITPEWRERYNEEIDYAMTKTDKMLRKLLGFVKQNQDYTLILCSGMGQAATIADHCYTELYINDLPVFVEAMGIKKWTWLPAMFPHFNITVEAKDIERMEKALDNLYIKGKQVSYTVYSNGQFSLHLGQQDLVDDYAVLFGEKVLLKDLGMSPVVIEDTAERTAYHIPEGSLLIYDPKNRDSLNASRERVSTLAISPSLLKRFSVEPPAYMTDEIILDIVNR